MTDPGDGPKLGAAMEGDKLQELVQEEEAQPLGMSLLASDSANGSSVDAIDETDSHDSLATADPQKTKAAIAQLTTKIQKTVELLKQEQRKKESNVNEYLRLSANADKQQLQRIKTVFEKKNQKSTQNIVQLQKKLETYRQRLNDVETHGVSSSHKQARDMFRDMGHGLKDVGANIRDGMMAVSGGVVDNIKGAKDSIVSKPKEIAHKLQGMKGKSKLSGSADNIMNIKGVEESQGSTDEGDKSHGGSNTLPSGFRYQSEDDASDISPSESLPRSGHSSSQPQSHSQALPALPQMDLAPLLRDLKEDSRLKIQEEAENLRGLLQADYDWFKQVLEEERYRSERLEEQLNDLTELHQHEVSNIKQELTSMEEKMEYQLEERTRDMQDLLESCQTRITKMELQQQQQQLISMEGFENSNFRALITKLINVVLALLAVVLVLVSTLANLLSPFLTTRLRILTTICLVAFIVALMQNWQLVTSCIDYLVQKFRKYIPL